MSIIRSRDRFSVKGLGNLFVRQVLPSPGATYDPLSYLDQTDFKDIIAVDVVADETGSVQNVVTKTEAVSIEPQLQQSSINEIAFIKGATGQKHSIRYHGMANPGMFQYYCIEQGVVVPSIVMKFDGKGKRILPMQVIAVKQDDSIFSTPEYYLLEAAGKVHVGGLQLWFSPRHLYNIITPMVLDVSGFVNHGTLNSDYATTIWQPAGSTPNSFLRFDGVNDICSVASAQNLEMSDGSNNSAMAIEGWFRIMGANGTQQILASKRSAMTTGLAGFALYRKTDNKIYFTAGSGGSDYNVVSTSTVLQNVWTHIAIVHNPAGTSQIYINGTADGSPVNLSAVTFGSTSNFYALGATKSNTGTIANNSQVDFSDHRFLQFPTAVGGLPSDMASRLPVNFASERSYHGV